MHIPSFVSHALTAVLPAFAMSAASAQKADYHDFTEMEAALRAFDGLAKGRITIHTIGRSYYGRPVYAVRLAAVDGTGAQKPDDGEKPALLIEAGMHAREWAGPELCLDFLMLFLFEWVTDRDYVDDVLDNASIWILPMVNPDGRAMDDCSGGDPERYWTSSVFHPSGTDYSGWRDNAQCVECSSHSALKTIGIDLNRNFSAGWNTAGERELDCNNNKYHGELPFQAREANVLRRFVNNHMISLSLSVHSFSSSVGNPHGGSDLPTNFASVWNARVPTELAISDSGSSGGGFGQFTAWLADPADTGGEPDMGTRRGVFSMLIELPPASDDEYNGVSPHPATYPYRFSMDDASNGFHPSARSFHTECADGFFRAVMYLAEQARSPWCALDPTTLAPDPTCVRDFGLTGSKIAPGRDSTGSLTFHYDGVAAKEVMKPGTRKVVYRVQNFDYTTGTTERVRVTVCISSRPTGAAFYESDLVDTQYFDLGPGDAATAGVPHSFASGRDYIVTIRATPVTYPMASETQDRNDYHLFRFSTLPTVGASARKPAVPHRRLWRG